jgi:hypothetical protein
MRRHRSVEKDKKIISVATVHYPVECRDGDRQTRYGMERLAPRADDSSNTIRLLTVDGILKSANWAV